MLLLLIQSSAYLFTPRYAANDGELETLRSSRKDVKEWLQEWDISGGERSQFLKSVIDAFIQSGQPLTTEADLALSPCNPAIVDCTENSMSTRDNTPTAVEALVFAAPDSVNICEDPSVVAAMKLWKVLCCRAGAPWDNHFSTRLAIISSSNILRKRRDINWESERRERQ
ncbi:hypothetical protein EV424DRAFT_1562039 [Suillus variegatus]|nr:hypothetical protein EV424DRAFT_1562039 [Suillus variegatus]